MKWADISISLILVGVCTYIFLETSEYPESIVPEAPGAALFPRVLASILFSLSILLFIHGWRGRAVERDRLPWKVVGKVSLSLAIIIAFWALLEVWDIFLMMPILLISLMVIMGERRIKTMISVSLLFDLFIYVIFYRIFHVMLPTLYF